LTRSSTPARWRSDRQTVELRSQKLRIWRVRYTFAPLLDEASKVRFPALVDEAHKAIDVQKHLVRGTTLKPVPPSHYFGQQVAARNGALLMMRPHARDLEPRMSHAEAARMLGMVGMPVEK